MYPSTWCHGAPGIGIARLMSLRHLNDAATRREIYAALKTTCEHGFGRGHSLCHGDLGNVDLLLLASEVLGEPKWRRAADHVAAAVVEGIRHHGWLCGTVSHQETPGFMTGLAGIGYQLLRLAEPDIVPSVLALRLPSLAPASRRVGSRPMRQAEHRTRPKSGRAEIGSAARPARFHACRHENRDT